MLRQIKVADLCKELEEKLVELQYSEDSMRRYCKVFQEFVEYAGDCDIKEISPHKMRHTKAMHLTEADVNPIFIRDFLGHTDLKVTEVYSKTSIKMKKAALDKMKSGKDVIPGKPVKDWTEDQALLDWLNGLKH